MKKDYLAIKVSHICAMIRLEELWNLSFLINRSERFYAETWVSYICNELDDIFASAMVSESFRRLAKETNYDFDVLEKRLQDLWQNVLLFPLTHEEEIRTIQVIMRGFAKVVTRMQSRHDSRTPFQVNDEYDVQDLLHALLSPHFSDIRKEESGPSIAGNRPRADFLLKKEKIFIELKMTRPNLRSKEIGQQLAQDIFFYRSHPDCKTLICFIYDPEKYIINPDGLREDLSKDFDGLRVIVEICQH